MKIKNWKHAIDLTIERHQLALDLKKSFSVIKYFKKPVEWTYACPLCQYEMDVHLEQKGEDTLCAFCPWVTIAKTRCTEPENIKHYRCDDVGSIKRLEEWKSHFK